MYCKRPEYKRIWVFIHDGRHTIPEFTSGSLPRVHFGSILGIIMGTGSFRCLYRCDKLRDFLEIWVSCSWVLPGRDILRTSLNIWVRTEWQFDATYEHNVSAMSHFGWIKFDLNWRIDFTARVMTRWYIHSKFTVLKNKLNQEEIWEYKTKFHSNDHK